MTNENQNGVRVTRATWDSVSADRARVAQIWGKLNNKNPDTLVATQAQWNFWCALLNANK